MIILGKIIPKLLFSEVHVTLTIGLVLMNNADPKDRSRRSGWTVLTWNFFRSMSIEQRLPVHCRTPPNLVWGRRNRSSRAVGARGAAGAAAAGTEEGGPGSRSRRPGRPPPFPTWRRH